MSIIKSIFISFSIYSKIPVWQFEWKEEDMKYTLLFFPWVGFVIGVAMYLWFVFCSFLGVNDICRVLFGTALPILITGGFHVDGYMDTMDALHSYQPREKKLEILKDAHIGAFAVIMIVLYYLIYAGAFAQMCDLDNFCQGFALNEAIIVWCLGFYLSRILSGIAVIKFKAAKKDGMLVTFADTAHKKIVQFGLYLQLVICIGVMLFFSVKMTILVVSAAIICFIYYYFKSTKEFGGITGDTAGFFVTICECGMTIATAIGGMI